MPEIPTSAVCRLADDLLKDKHDERRFGRIAWANRDLLVRVLRGFDLVLGGRAPNGERDIGTHPYDVQEKRVVAYLMRLTENQVGAGDDPIGFLIASHNYLRQRQRNDG